MLQAEGILDSPSSTLRPLCALCDEDDEDRLWEARRGRPRRELLGCGRLPVSAATGEVVDLVALLERHPDATDDELTSVYPLATLGWIRDAVGTPWPSCPRFWARRDLVDTAASIEADLALSKVAALGDGALDWSTLDARERELVRIARRVKTTIAQRRAEEREAARQ